MKNLFLIIEKYDVKKSREHLNTLKGSFIHPNVFKMEVAEENFNGTINGIDFILSGINYDIIVNDLFSIN
jgi:hypothetical protein